MPSKHLNRHIDRVPSSGRVLLGAGQIFTGYFVAAARRYFSDRIRLRRSLANALVTIFITLFCVLSSPNSVSQPNTKRILILFSFSNRGNYERLNLLKSRLQSAIEWPIDFYVEYLEGRRLDDPEYKGELTETLRHMYRGANLDLVVIVSYAGLQFAVNHHGVLFPCVPIVFFGVDPDLIAGQTWPGVTGVTAKTGIRESVDLALHLHPNANTVAIITANSTPDRYFLSRIHAELLHHQGTVREVDLIGLPTNQLLEKVATLTPQTIVFFQLAPQESLQPAIGTNDLLTWIAQRLPTYSIFPYDVLGHGGIGGATYDRDEELGIVGKEASRVLSGERPEDIPIEHLTDVQMQVDWRALRRWHIREASLPPGTLVLNREPTPWERYRKYIVAALSLILAQALLIAGLIWQRARKRKAEAVLRESEQRFYVMANTTPSLVWMCDATGNVTYLNERRIAFTGRDPNAGFGDTWSMYIHPDDRAKVQNANSCALKRRQPFSKEYRLRRRDGVYRWMFDVAAPRLNGDGSFNGFIGSAIDVTDQKLAQQALEHVSGQLIEAQEQERTRIARDLHDDICQRLAALSMELERAKHASSGRVSATKSLEEIRQHCAEIAGDVQSLSHELHPSKLDLLGIVAAIRGFCREFSKLHGVTVDFSDTDVPRALPKDASLCLFRVAQESLHNAVKYSGTNHVKVELSATANDVRLQVKDEGAGFDVEEAKSRGLGLVSMQERVHLVHGEFSVESKPGAGTTILACVPIPAEKEGFREDDTTRETASARELR